MAHHKQLIKANIISYSLVKYILETTFWPNQMVSNCNRGATPLNKKIIFHV